MVTVQRCIDEKLIEGICDVLCRTHFKGTGTPSHVFVFLEHQLTTDRMLPCRLLKYRVRDNHLDENKTGRLPCRASAGC
ncbi:Rpn family recombination-promoting nuclease/putative transposase [Desulfosarcina sp. OttesenSCG-928-G10]|nr:Rpn family recombination-promoting nuclease/putative transposase [Desulfosarcina sp. OttesenSCG-928-G10]MDL2321354.1 Rpn family recombination-promoting nuclease/putative transposase [Desulfosarcina sp. OttesenSCG-928-B08]